jgi:hypothetical protein
LFAISVSSGTTGDEPASGLKESLKANLTNVDTTTPAVYDVNIKRQSSLVLR